MTRPLNDHRCSSDSYRRGHACETPGSSETKSWQKESECTRKRNEKVAWSRGNVSPISPSSRGIYRIARFKKRLTSFVPFGELCQRIARKKKKPEHVREVPAREETPHRQIAIVRRSRTRKYMHSIFEERRWEITFRAAAGIYWHDPHASSC